jgi:cation diffusion facilitator CzcD-associated flavoprotein CzcO
MTSVAIVGAGIGGLGLAMRLKRAGMDDFVVLERSDGVGGTWRHNSYPGAACDVPSHLYSYSFARNPNWSKTYANQPEILAYLQACAEHAGVLAHLRTGWEAVGATWSEADRRWTIVSRDGEKVDAAVAVFAVGMLDRPFEAPLEGLGTFAGHVFHSAQWDHDHDLTGRRVGIVGTGASAIQIFPEVSAVAAYTTLFQRSAPYLLPRRDFPYSEEAKRRFARNPIAARRERWNLYRSFERNTAFRVSDPRVDELQSISLSYLARRVQDEELRAKLTPDYRFGCKRVLVSSDYYKAVNQENVEIVTDPIARVGPSGIETSSGRRIEFDTLVMATGFRASDYLYGIEVVGRDGRKLHDEWADGAFAYLGMTVAGFPNLFLLYGPNTNQGGNSIIFILEAQGAYVVRALRAMRRRRARAVEVRPSVMQRYDQETQAAMAGTVWASGCSNYFANAKGRIVTQLPHPSRWYWRRTRWFARREYEFSR